MIIFKKLSSGGDTIVEVLIAVALIGVILAGTYAIANRSSTAIRQSQERTDALKIAETQIEQLKVLSQDTSSNIFVISPPFCTFNQTPAVPDLTTQPAASNNCKVNNGITYSVSINRSHTGNSYLFDITISWDSAVGNALKDKVNLKYSIDQ